MTGYLPGLMRDALNVDLWLMLMQAAGKKIMTENGRGSITVHRCRTAPATVREGSSRAANIRPETPASTCGEA